MKLSLRLLLVLVLVSIFSLSAIAQEPVHWDVVQKIRDEGINNSQVMDNVSWMTDVFGPRLAHSPSYLEAAEWAKKKFEEYGLVNAEVEAWGEFGLGWRNDYTSVHMMTPQYMPIIAYPNSWTSGTNGKVTGKVVYVNYSEIMSQEDLDALKPKIRNAIIFTSAKRNLSAKFTADAVRKTQEDLDEMARTNLGGGGGDDNITISRAQLNQLLGGGGRGGRGGRGNAPRPLERNRINEFLQDNGAAVFVSPGSGDDGTVYVYGRTVRTKDEPKPPATLTMAAEHYNRIMRILEKGIEVEMEVEIRTSFYDDDLNDYNVVAEIPGSDLAHELVMLGGHFDATSSGTGATDNGSGSAVAMEAVRILKAIGVQPRRTIRVALWGAEETGLEGSRGYVANHFASRPGQRVRGGSDNRPIEIVSVENYNNFAGYFNMDNGTGKFRGVYLQGNELVRPIFTEWMKPFRDLEMTHLSPGNTGGTDHLAFDGVYLPGWQFIQDAIEYGSRTHHSNMDVYDRLVPADLMQNAIIMASFVYHTAMRDEKLPRKSIPDGIGIRVIK